MAPFIWTNAKGAVALPQTPFNPNGWKKCKKAFIEFVKYYNVEKIALNLSLEEKESLQKLHHLWSNATTPADSYIEYYYEMDPFHEALNGKLENISVWQQYTKTFKDWRMECLMSRMIGCTIPLEPEDA